CARSPGAYW
nr:immunoglobulin heavy chain junction region [Mus musculus]